MDRTEQWGGLHGSHRWVEQFADLSAHLMAGLTPAEIEGVVRHLGECQLCRAGLLVLETVSTLDGVPPEALLDGPPDDAELFVRRVLRRLRAEAASFGRANATGWPSFPRQHRAACRRPGWPDDLRPPR